jgi:signal peptidase I
VWINDAPLQEPYLDKTPDNQTDATGGVLAAGEYFVMGDNRANSDDSRTYGPITDDDIIGRAVRILGPFSRMSGLPSPQYE